MWDNFLFKEKNQVLFWKHWGSLIDTTKSGPRYLPTELEIWLTISKNKNLFCFDKSFIYLLRGKPVAGVFLPIEKQDKNKTISVAGGYVIAPMTQDKSVEEKIFKAIDNIAAEHKVGKIMFGIDPLDNNRYNYLQKYNYLDTSMLSYVFDLTKENLLDSCRRNHKRNIKKIRDNKDFTVFYIDNNSPSYEIHEEYRTLHHKCSGRITRSKDTFDAQYEKLKKGKAVLFGLNFKQKNVAFLYFDYNADKAVSVSAADDPDYDSLPLYHILYYMGMEYLKKAGVCYIDTGNPSSPSPQFDYYPDNKQKNIALFKRGFGGEYWPYFRGIKYFSREAFKKDMSDFINNFEISKYE